MARPGRGRTNARGKGAARSGIRLKNGQYKVFDSQRVKDLDSEDERESVPAETEEIDDESSGAESDDELQPVGMVYNTLLQSFVHSNEHHPRKRRKLDDSDTPEVHLADVEGQQDLGQPALEVEEDDVNDVVSDPEAAAANGDLAVDEPGPAENGQEEDSSDPFEVHFANHDENELSRRLESIQAAEWKTEKHNLGDLGAMTLMVPACADASAIRKPCNGFDDLHLKQRVLQIAQNPERPLSRLQQYLAPYFFNYIDALIGNRAPGNALDLRRSACLHVLNHVLKGRDRVLKNTARLSHAQEDLDLRDQGFARPKVLVLLESRQMCAKYAECIAELFQPEQQENLKRFRDSFHESIDNDSNMPKDYKELFEGNSDNNFLTALKFTRKTLKYFSAFYKSDIILASPLGLRRVIEHEDKKKRDWDFLSSIEVCVVDQADAMQMQSFENLEIVLNHLNLQPQDMHGSDISRVRSWYLDGHARYLRQTIVFSSYITPEMNRIFSSSMLNVAGKLKLQPEYEGAISRLGGLGIKQTFSRFDTRSPAGDPDARFKFFTSSILPALLRLPRPSDGAQGILLYVPSYYDFLRIRNHFATSTQTQNISFGAIHDYSDVSSQRRARSHFLTGRHSFLLYTQRAHHFFRLRIKGVKRAIFYGPPDNAIFYEELVGGFLGTSLTEGKVSVEEAGARTMFSKWDGLRLERVVGSQRVKSLLSGVGDTFDFV